MRKYYLFYDFASTGCGKKYLFKTNATGKDHNYNKFN